MIILKNVRPVHENKATAGNIMRKAVFLPRHRGHNVSFPAGKGTGGIKDSPCGMEKQAYLRLPNIRRRLRTTLIPIMTPS